VRCSKIVVLVVCIAGIFLFTTASQAFCGIILHKESYKVIPGSKILQSRQLWTEYYQGNKIAVHQSHAVFITDLNSDVLINISPVRKIYSVDMTEDFLKKMQNLVRQIRKQLEKSGKHLSTYCKFKNLIIKKTGKTKKIAGYSCNLIEILSGKNKIRDIWVTSKIPVAKEIDVKKALDKKRDIKQVFCDLTQEDDLDLSPAYQKIFRDGRVAMAIVTYNPRDTLTEKITKVEVVAIPESIFKAPESYKKVPIEAFMQHSQGK